MTPGSDLPARLRALLEQVLNVLEGVEWNGPMDEFYEHAVKATSQYDQQYRQMAREILASRQALRACAAALQGSETAPPEGWQIDDVPPWIQIQAGSELDHLVDVIRFAPGQTTGFLHSAHDAAGLLWRWFLKWTPKLKAADAPAPAPQWETCPKCGAIGCLACGAPPPAPDRQEER